MTVNEDPWVLRCPRCGDTSQHTQCPITLGTPQKCGECPDNPWRDKENPAFHEILYFLCMKCKTRYLTPKVSKDDTTYRLFSHDG